MIARHLLYQILERALWEDLHAGDLTTQAVVDPHARAVGHARAVTELVACGAEVFAGTFYRVDPGVRVERLVEDGTLVEPDTELWRVEGAATSILMAERVALNFVQRLCGIATLARRYVEAVPEGCKARITGTRKTTPGLRLLERYALRCGGAHNHRDSLGAGVLIKDNHIEAAGGVRRAIELAQERAPHTARVEVEVETLDALDEALDAGADIVMLDNFAPDEVVVAVKRARGRALLEVSGRVTLGAIPELARAGVDVISVGALTHSAPASDIALDLKPL